MTKEFQKVFTYFKTITAIPHGSTNCEGMRDFLCRFAQNHGLRYRSDAANNVVIFKAAGAGFENRAPVILQGHIDMVCADEDGYAIDFLKEGLTLEEHGDFLSAKGTSLGADDGIAVAMMLALLESDLPLPSLECIFTADEEIGMIGASALDMSDIKGKYLINIDSEDEGVLTVSCAGGSTAVVHVPIQKESINAYCYTIDISGLAGGHSGVEIIKRGLNANKLLAEVLKALPPCRIVSIGGGEKENAIAARASLCVAFETPVNVNEPLAALEAEWKKTEENLRLACRKEGLRSVQAFDAASSCRVAEALSAMPQGIIKMSEYDASAVQTSLNLGVLEQNESEVLFTFSVRSSVEAERKALEEELAAIAKKANGSISLSGIYPGWAYKEDSVLRQKAVAVYEKLYGSTPQIEAIHAGLECGVLLAKKPDLDCISLGPQLYDVHTARERLSLSSAARTWEYVLELIRAL